MKQIIRKHCPVAQSARGARGGSTAIATATMLPTLVGG